MKLITAVVRPERAGEVKAALLRLGVGGMTLVRASGHGGERDLVQRFRARSVVLEFHERVRVEVAVPDGLADAAVAAIVAAARTGRVGDGKVFVQDLERVVRIRTGETGADALAYAEEVGHERG